MILSQDSGCKANFHLCRKMHGKDFMEIRGLGRVSKKGRPLSVRLPLRFANQRTVAPARSDRISECVGKATAKVF